MLSHKCLVKHRQNMASSLGILIYFQGNVDYKEILVKRENLGTVDSLDLKFLSHFLNLIGV